MNEEVEELLENIEWQTRLAHCHSVDSSGGRSQCHICWNEKYQGHREDCKLFQALAKLRTEQPPNKRQETKMTKEICCQIDCKKDAEWEIYAKNVPDTVACTDHVGELLTDAKEHRIFRIIPEGLNNESRKNKSD